MNQDLVLAVFPLPWEIPVAAGKRVRFVRLNRSDLAGLQIDGAARGLDARALLVTEAVKRFGDASVWSGGSSDLKEIHGALVAALGPGTVRSFPWPLRAEPDALAAEFEAFSRVFGLAGLAQAEEVHRRDERLRAGLRSWEAGQGESAVAPYPSGLYLDTLAAVAAEGVLETPPLLPSPPSARAPDARRLRLGLLGGVELLTDLPGHIERLAARVVLDEWTHATAFVAPAAGLLERYLELGLPYGLAARAMRLRDLEAPRRIDGWVLVTSPFGASNLERLGFPRWLSRPVLALEAEARRPLTGADGLRLEAFLRSLAEAR